MIARGCRILSGRGRHGESILLIPVPEASHLLHDCRPRYIVGTESGLPDHVTLLYPFLRPATLDETVIARLQQLFCAVQPFHFFLRSLGWFGEDVLYLVPEPPAPFIGLTQQIMDEFGVRPYDGAFTENVPHITVAQHAGAEMMRGIEDRVVHRLPAPATAREVWLMEHGRNKGWETRKRFSLGQPSGLSGTK